MQNSSQPNSSSQSTRRQFLSRSSQAVVAGGLALNSSIVKAAFAAGDETIRVGLVGCGGRGTGAAAQALRADPNTKLVALGDAFADQVEKSLANLKKQDIQDRVDVPQENQFAGFDAYQGVIANSDVVLLATPPHFRPQHLKACIDANKHVFAEKPVAVDPTGIRSILATCEEAEKKKLSVVSGLCWRYETGMQETIGKIHDGALGDIVTLHSTRFLGGVGKLAKREPDWTDIEYQMRNWYYFTWLSGDFNVEQFVHEMDKMSWVMGGQYPVRCYSTGGRQTRTADYYGNVYDHFNTVFEYENGVKYFASTRHQAGCSNLFFDHVHGTEGQADLMKYSITGKNPWKGPRRRTVMHQLEHDAMYAALRKGETINNGEYMAKSTMLGIMARMSAYTGKILTWEQAMDSKLRLGPEKYDWNLPFPDPPVAMPGATPFV